MDERVCQEGPVTKVVLRLAFGKVEQVRAKTELDGCDKVEAVGAAPKADVKASRDTARPPGGKGAGRCFPFPGSRRGSAVSTTGGTARGGQPHPGRSRQRRSWWVAVLERTCGTWCSLRLAKVAAMQWSCVVSSCRLDDPVRMSG